MNILSRPDLVDRLAAAYALGTLRAGARRRFETLARSSPALRVQAQVWQERFTSITELQHAEAPSPNVWKRIENQLAAETQPLPVREPLAARVAERARNWWRLGTLAAVAASLAAVAVTLRVQDQLEGTRAQLAQVQARERDAARRNTELVAQLQAMPEVRYVSVLHDDKATPTMLVMYDPKHTTMTLKRMVDFHEGPEKSLQLWAIPPSGAPRSLGVLSDQPVLRMAAAEQVVGQSPALAISLEPKGGVPGEGGPTGPVLWKGAVLQTPL
ncbi:MAG TPA: anti-sigma factor [Ramlibacter sp.]|jgi:anti-sigma-K factor RskA|nr:anti-sigma factor [Ramlibacter sp.]